MATFEQLFPTFWRSASSCTRSCRSWHSCCSWSAPSVSSATGFGQTMLLHLVRLLVLTALLVMLPEWGNRVQELLQNSVLTALGVDPKWTHRQYNALLVIKREGAPVVRGGDILTTERVHGGDGDWVILVGPVCVLFCFGRTSSRRSHSTWDMLFPCSSALLASSRASVQDRDLPEPGGVLLWPLLGGRWLPS